MNGISTEAAVVFAITCNAIIMLVLFYFSYKGGKD